MNIPIDDSKVAAKGEKAQGAYYFMMGTNLHGALFAGIKGAMLNATVLQVEMQQTLAKLLLITDNALLQVKQEEIEAQKSYLKELDGNPDSATISKVTTELNAVKEMYNAKEQSASTQQNQQTQAQQSLEQAAANLINNANSELDILAAIAR